MPRRAASGLIESDWNLKGINAELRMGGPGRINRIRLEFKAVYSYISNIIDYVD